MAVFKQEGYALTRKGYGLHFEQVGDREIAVYGVDNIDDATLFKTQAEAFQNGFNMRHEIGEWDYMVRREDLPESVVKVVKLIDVEEVADLKFANAEVIE